MFLKACQGAGGAFVPCRRQSLGPGCLAQALTPSTLAQTSPSQRPVRTSLFGSVPRSCRPPLCHLYCPGSSHGACLTADALQTLAGRMDESTDECTHANACTILGQH